MDLCVGVMYGMVTLTGLQRGMLRLDAMRSMSLFSTAVWA